MKPKKEVTTIFLVAIACLSVLLLISSIQPKAFAFDTTCNVGNECMPWGAGPEAVMECRDWCESHNGMQEVNCDWAECAGGSYPNCTCYSSWTCVCKDEEMTTYYYYESAELQCSNLPIK